LGAYATRCCSTITTRTTGATGNNGSTRHKALKIYVHQTTTDSTSAADALVADATGTTFASGQKHVTDDCRRRRENRTRNGATDATEATGTIITAGCIIARAAVATCTTLDRHVAVYVRFDVSNRQCATSATDAAVLDAAVATRTARSGGEGKTLGSDKGINIGQHERTTGTTDTPCESRATGATLTTGT